ncbi:dihydroorotate dehydrogenase [candidate division KSB1 bacterium]|nr:dihydroorotate dehydrogenase [candidate division KSB1 bacterium]NIR72799.1 dihydroorotate dehydrogenase [candidate division KSB1 bacterium]NIS28218.1 dihydroorotate dehydrogenase [candidate division KSB1 bacterium]NIT75109.1 dihydroorotate dehydrogenase [candidate division KSB1 bacterium]NIU28896.1 dihydroorotate dehydrogenase [candidate division KSB1 bacterium]
MDLTLQIGTMTLKNPVLVASGTFGYGQECQDLVDLNVLGGIITKSITLKPRDGNPPPRIVELPAGMLNSIGLANVGVETFIAEKLSFLRTVDTTIVVNVAGSTAEEFLAVVRRLDDEDDIDAYELNFSCPNVKEGGLEFSQDANITAKVMSLIRKATSRPLIAKLTPNVTKVGEIARAAEENGANAVSLINTLVGMAIDINSQRARIATTTGGYSGPAIKPVALAKVYEVSQVVQIPIIGIGGIMSGQDALEFILAGASAIEVGTANYIDPSTGVRIVDSIKQYCRKYKLASVRELVGALRPAH